MASCKSRQGANSFKQVQTRVRDPNRFDLSSLLPSCSCSPLNAVGAEEPVQLLAFLHHIEPRQLLSVADIADFFTSSILRLHLRFSDLPSSLTLPDI